jgi:hypothetical protein
VGRGRNFTQRARGLGEAAESGDCCSHRQQAAHLEGGCRSRVCSSSERESVTGGGAFLKPPLQSPKNKATANPSLPICITIAFTQAVSRNALLSLDDRQTFLTRHPNGRKRLHLRSSRCLYTPPAQGRLPQANIVSNVWGGAGKSRLGCVSRDDPKAMPNVSKRAMHVGPVVSAWRLLGELEATSRAPPSQHHRPQPAPGGKGRGYLVFLCFVHRARVRNRDLRTHILIGFTTVLSSLPIHVERYT